MGWAELAVLLSSSNFPSIQGNKHLKRVSILQGLLQVKVKGQTGKTQASGYAASAP